VSEAGVAAGSDTASRAEETSLVSDWFGAAYERLHPLLQQLHRHRASRLEGTVGMRFGRGLAGVLGRRLARRLGMPAVAGPQRLVVDVSHDATLMHWQRRFGDGHAVLSLFRPVGHFPDGHWVEDTGRIALTLQVDIAADGWDWRLVGARMRGKAVPLWLLPRFSAYKRVVDGRYSFHVGFALPVLGDLMAYEGLLDPVPVGGASAPMPVPVGGA
jgi:hypothetical protein